MCLKLQYTKHKEGAISAQMNVFFNPHKANCKQICVKRGGLQSGPFFLHQLKEDSFVASHVPVADYLSSHVLKPTEPGQEGGTIDTIRVAVFDVPVNGCRGFWCLRDIVDVIGMKRAKKKRNM